MARVTSRSRRERSEEEDDEDVIGGTKKKNHLLNFAKFGLTAAAGAIVGYFAVEKVRDWRSEKNKEKKKEEEEEAPKANPVEQAMAAFMTGAHPNPFAGPPPINVNFFGGQVPFAPMRPPEPPMPPKPPEWSEKPPNPLDQFTEFDEE